jgi:hypothetical protein
MLSQFKPQFLKSCGHVGKRMKNATNNKTAFRFQSSVATDTPDMKTETIFPQYEINDVAKALNNSLRPFDGDALKTKFAFRYLISKDASGVCNFDTTLKEIQDNKELEASGVKDLIQQVCLALNTNQDKLFPAELDGIILKNARDETVLFYNSDLPPTTKSPRLLFVDSYVLRKAIREIKDEDNKRFYGSLGKDVYVTHKFEFWESWVLGLGLSIGFNFCTLLGKMAAATA